MPQKDGKNLSSQSNESVLHSKSAVEPNSAGPGWRCCVRRTTWSPAPPESPPRSRRRARGV